MRASLSSPIKKGRAIYGHEQYIMKGLWLYIALINKKEYYDYAKQWGDKHQWQLAVV